MHHVVTEIGVEVGVGRARLALRDGLLAGRPIRVDPEGAKVAVVATTALLLGGDSVELQLTVGTGAWLEIVETAGTVVYDARGVRSAWTLSARVEPGGLLLWNGEPFVIACGADVSRSSSIVLGEGAAACLRETMVLGRTSEVGGAADLRSQVAYAGRPLLVERLDLADSLGRSAPGALGAARVLDTVSLFGVRAPTDPALPVGARFDLDGPGTLARYLGTSCHASPVRGWWPAWSAAARQQFQQRRAH